MKPSLKKTLMNCVKNPPNSHCIAITLLVGVAAIIVAFALLICGCTTETPHTVNSSAYSWDGTNQNSGVIGFVGNQIEVSPHWRDRYNGLGAIYSKKFVPPLAFDYGLTPTIYGTYLVTPEAFKDFVDMNRWRKVDLVK